MNPSLLNEDIFLNQCQHSSQSAYQNWKDLLGVLTEPSTRNIAIRFFHSLATKIQREYSPAEMMSRFHFSIDRLSFKQGERKLTHLFIFQLPSTFSPEEWSFTFFEGLARYRSSEFQDRVLLELGCGIGWVSIALAKQCNPKKIIGVDINPKAILCSKLNLFLNAFDQHGQPTWSSHGKTLLDIVDFYSSDLFETCRIQGIFIDRIIGCIPQVLNPDPDFLKKKRSEHLLETENDEFLYSLSNYTPNQGYLEDEFGLGLIARTVEESVDILNPGGKVILNLGQRPGSHVIQRLFERRGFSVNTVWKTQVSQAKDTNIKSLVSIEDRSTHRFEFYMGIGSNIPISAKTALAYAESGGEIAHGLAVHEAQPREPSQLPKLLQFIRKEGYEKARRELDLSYQDENLTIEKISFLNSLIDYLELGGHFPYEATAGMKSFKEHLSLFFNRYYKLFFEPDSYIITPSRAATCENILSCFQGKRILVDSILAGLIEKKPEILEIPRSSELACELIEKLRPEVVIYSIPPHEAKTRDIFVRLCEISKKSNSRLFIDISELVELSSSTESNGIFRYLSKNNLPQHVSLFCGLVKNRLYDDLEVCFVVSENSELIEFLEKAAELTYSRTPVLSQLFYDRVIQDLIHFQILDAQPGRLKKPQRQNIEPLPKEFIDLSPSAKRAFQHPAIADEKTARSPGIIRMDYGENCFRTPQIVQQAILEAYSKIRVSQKESVCDLEVKGILSKRCNFDPKRELHLHYGGGVAPLFSKLVNRYAHSGFTLLFPSGGYGHFFAASKFFDAKSITVPTNEADSFKLNPAILNDYLLKIEGRACLVLNGPLVNPTGAVYTQSELDNLLEVLNQHKAHLIVDTIFSGLEFSSQTEGKGSILNFARFPDLKWSVLGGLSKEFAAAGLRIGYCATSDAFTHSILNQQSQNEPSAALKLVTRTIYSHLLQGDPTLVEELQIQRNDLHNRARRVSEVLSKTGWKVIKPQGGLFLIAKPLRTFSDHLSTGDYYRTILQVAINSPEWTGIENYYRFVLSIPKDEFDEGVSRLEKA